MTAADGVDSAIDPGVRRQMPLPDQVIDALNQYVTSTMDVTQHVARWLGVGTADAEAFGHVAYAQDRGTPISPKDLARRIGLSTGATTTLINRLESAGLVVRSREHRDRRVVTLRIPPDVEEQTLRFFAPLRDRVDALMKQHPPELLRQLVTVLDELNLATADVVRSLESSRPRHGS
ncbi:hypothetical protein Aph02nite_45390 [Actinoplanes philippinensis]|uniref:MarR family protein n=1 Tax=Actinoplanes philippinensis TaxID=35752 RepID=A0A1I2I594_9ACTN|nr:MarR family transcriptional regulator [Actinoplanes philippinensis]GIE78589.1 hypothetical protein Aph02nite_45390 [Actinoplanes philippinensis]SFF37639.1 MarR family protein [Actinoplanes philippinensis]